MSPNQNPPSARRTLPDDEIAKVVKLAASTGRIVGHYRASAAFTTDVKVLRENLKNAADVIEVMTESYLALDLLLQRNPGIMANGPANSVRSAVPESGDQTRKS